MLRLIVSPAKTVVPEEGPLPLGEPAFLAEAEALTERLRSMDRDALQRLWRTSDALTGKALAAWTRGRPRAAARPCSRTAASSTRPWRRPS